MPKTVVAANAEKGVVLKANASKASARPAAPKTTRESTKKAASVVKAKVPAKAVPVPDHKVAKPDSVRLSGREPTKVPAPAKAAKAAPSVPKPTAKAAPAAKTAAKTPVKAPVTKAAASRVKAVAKPAVAAKQVPGSVATPEKKPRGPVSATKQAAAPKAGSVVTKAAEPTKASPPARKAAASPARPAGGLGSRAATTKRDADGYAKDARFVATQRASLLRERATYLEQAASLKAEAEALVEEMEPGDIQFDDESGEGGTVTVDRERDLALSAQALAAVEEIDHTLAKLDNGAYGICENCGRLIVKARLEALPYARLCIDCKSGGLSKR